MHAIPYDAANQRELLAGLSREFPGYEFDTQSTRRGVSLVATARTTGNGVHTVITRDPAELRVALSGSGSMPEPS
jgi:hypothetical protein